MEQVATRVVGYVRAFVSAPPGIARWAYMGHPAYWVGVRAEAYLGGAGAWLHRHIYAASGRDRKVGKRRA